MFNEDKIYFTSDTHFGHTNIIEYCNRPFKNAYEMDQKLIQNWNTVVPEDGHVFHLGDFAMCNPGVARKIREQLNGKIYLVIGNHEGIAYRIKDCFEWMKSYYELVLQDRTMICLLHYAMRVWNKYHYGSLHLYGHSHATLEELNNKSCDIGIDNPMWNYSPVSLKNVRDYLSTKPIGNPVDHHGNNA